MKIHTSLINIVIVTFILSSCSSEDCTPEEWEGIYTVTNPMECDNGGFAEEGDTIEIGIGNTENTILFNGDDQELDKFIINRDNCTVSIEGILLLSKNGEEITVDFDGCSFVYKKN